MSSITVRPATSADFEAVSRLLAELGRPPVSDQNREAVRQVYLNHLQRSDTASMVAEGASGVIGFLSLEFRKRLNRTEPQAWVPDLIVTDTARGTGAGKALLQAAFAEARRRGCWGLSLESGYARQVAHKFYEMQGMTDAGKYFTIGF